jgi:hypothetical protein
MDGRPLAFSRTLTRGGPTNNEWPCDCGGTVYASPKSPYGRCSAGETRCNRCRREARRYRGTYTCGVGCVPREPRK